MKLNNFTVSISLGGIVLAALLVWVFVILRAEAYDVKGRYCNVQPQSVFCQMYPPVKEKNL